VHLGRDGAGGARLLPGVADGTVVAALAWTTAAGHWHPAEVACGARPPAGNDDWSISGEAHYVLDGGQASVHLVPARMPDGGIGLFEVQPGQPRLSAVDAKVHASPTLGDLILESYKGRTALPAPVEAMEAYERAKAGTK